MIPADPRRAFAVLPEPRVFRVLPELRRFYILRP